MPHDIPFGRPMVGKDEAKAVADVLRSPWLAHGPKGKEFEKAFAAHVGAGHAVALSSCTAALHLSLSALGIGPGDEVVVPAQTHVATAHAVMYVGARPVFADIDPDTYNISPDSMKSRLSPSTRAVAVVHFAGLPCAMDEILETARTQRLHVIEDCAHALGARTKGRYTGTMGTTGCFSFYPIKHMTTGEGGMLTTADPGIADRVSKLRAFGIDAAPSERIRPGIYDAPFLGFNYRMTEMEAAMGLVQLKKAQAMVEKRIENAGVLNERLRDIPGLVLPQVPEGSTHSYFFYQLRLTRSFPLSRDELAARLKGEGIGTSIYYATPVHLMTFYRKTFGGGQGDLPEAEKAAQETLALPVHALLGRKDMTFIAEAIKSCAL